MLDFFLVMVAAASAAAGSSGPPAAPQAAAAPPAFLAPEEAPAPPAFLAPAPQLVAEPQVPSGKFTTATEVRPILAATRANWIAVREYDGQDLLYVTQLWSWRCGLVQMRIGVNGAPPEPWPLPPCREDQPAPNMILEEDGLPFRSYAPGSVAVVDVILTFDDLSEEQARFERQAVLMP